MVRIDRQFFGRYEVEIYTTDTFFEMMLIDDVLAGSRD